MPQFTVRENLLLGSHRLAPPLRPRGHRTASVRGAGGGGVPARGGGGQWRRPASPTSPTPPSTSCPTGTARLVEVVRALLAKPHTILLDEPAAGLSDVEIGALSELIRGMKASGLTILLIDHRMDFPRRARRQHRRARLRAGDLPRLDGGDAQGPGGDPRLPRPGSAARGGGARPCLRVSELCVSYGAVEATKDITLTAPEGSTTAILGANGAGKSLPTAGDLRRRAGRLRRHRRRRP